MLAPRAADVRASLTHRMSQALSNQDFASAAQVPVRAGGSPRAREGVRGCVSGPKTVLADTPSPVRAIKMQHYTAGLERDVNNELQVRCLWCLTSASPYDEHTQNLSVP